MSESPFSTFTLWQYRNLAVAGLASGAFFVALGGPGFKGGLNFGLGLALVTSGIYFLVMRRYVQRRLDWPIEYWTAQQRRMGGRFWATAGSGVTLGVITTIVAVFSGAFWITGLAVGLTLLPALLVVGKLTGQVGNF